MQIIKLLHRKLHLIAWWNNKSFLKNRFESKKFFELAWLLWIQCIQKFIRNGLREYDFVSLSPKVWEKELSLFFEKLTILNFSTTKNIRTYKFSLTRIFPSMGKSWSPQCSNIGSSYNLNALASVGSNSGFIMSS